jgi:hypothetical protein
VVRWLAFGADRGRQGRDIVLARGFPTRLRRSSDRHQVNAHAVLSRSHPGPAATSAVKKDVSYDACSTCIACSVVSAGSDACPHLGRIFSPLPTYLADREDGVPLYHRHLTALERSPPLIAPCGPPAGRMTSRVLQELTTSPSIEQSALRRRIVSRQDGVGAAGVDFSSLPLPSFNGRGGDPSSELPAIFFSAGGTIGVCVSTGKWDGCQRNLFPLLLQELEVFSQWGLGVGQRQLGSRYSTISAWWWKCGRVLCSSARSLRRVLPCLIIQMPVTRCHPRHRPGHLALDAQFIIQSLELNACASRITAKQGKTRAKNGVIDCRRESRRLSPSAVDPRSGRVVVVLQMRGPRGGDGERGTGWGTDFTALNAAEPSCASGTSCDGNAMGRLVWWMRLSVTRAPGSIVPSPCWSPGAEGRYSGVARAYTLRQCTSSPSTDQPPSFLAARHPSLGEHGT